ncbi:PAS domain-containing protein [Halosolutus halophilus]|uniref:PAS domain-containing protein n=1 Tax=Halosolutus halophilus TaxID=1552990 RepID=UPI002234F1C7|nr:PAS domain-containing protein [Halosolutus halophilus]
MNSGLASPEPIPVRVLVVGSSDWGQRVSTAFEDDEITITISGPVADVDDAELASADCVLTDDRAVLSAVESKPVLFVVESDADRDVGGLLDDDATDVIPEATIDDPPLLAHRLRQTIQFHSTRAAVERREEWFRALIERSSDLLTVLSESGQVTYVSPSVERVVGAEPTELLGNHVIDSVHPDDRADVVQTFDAVCDDDLGTTRTVEYRYLDDDDTWGIYEAVLTNRLDDPVVGGVIASIRDVTQFHRVQQELGESFERVTDAFFALDTEFRFTYVNDRAGELLDFEPGDLLGREFLEVFPGMQETEFERQSLEAMDEQEPRTLERYYDPYDMWIEARIYPSRSGISVYFRDVTDRVERKRELAERTERLQVLVENAPIILYVLDDDGTFTLSEGRGLENIGIEPGEVIGNSVFEVFDNYPDVCDDARRALNGESVHRQRRIRDRVFESWYRPITREGTIDRVIGVAVDVTERVQYQEALNALHEATTHLLAVESKQAACEYIVDVATDVLDLDSVVYRFDEQHNELVPAAYSAEFESAIGSPPRLGPDGGSAWQTFVDGTPTVFDDVDASEQWFDASAVRSGLYVPLGEHGVLVALSPESNEYDEETVELAELFATTAEAALDRIGRTRRLHDHERELKQQNIHLERLNHANQVRQDIEQLLLMADSRTEIEEGICDRLVDLESCSMAWIGEPDPSGNQIRSRTVSGLDRGYLDSVAVTTVEDTAAEPAGRTARSRTPTHVENVADAVRDGAWRADALSRNFQSVYAVPLVYDDFLYGVLTIYGEDRDVFDETLRSTLAELGETIAYTIDAVKRKNALVDDDRTEVELELDRESTLCRLATRLDARLTFEGATSREDGSTIVFVSVDRSIDGADLDGSAADVDGIEHASIIADIEAQTLVQLQFTGSFLGSIVDAHGATLRAFTTDGTTARAVIDVPDAIEIREVLSDIERHGIPASMVARREQPTAEDTSLDARSRNALLETLTDRQREVVQTAFHGGFFEWPRETTGEEIAESLDISAPAFHKHVRSVEGKLFTALFDSTTAVPDG